MWGTPDKLYSHHCSIVFVVLAFDHLAVSSGPQLLNDCIPTERAVSNQEQSLQSACTQQYIRHILSVAQAVLRQADSGGLPAVRESRHAVDCAPRLDNVVPNLIRRRLWRVCSLQKQQESSEKNSVRMSKNAMAVANTAHIKAIQSGNAPSQADFYCDLARNSRSPLQGDHGDCHFVSC